MEPIPTGRALAQHDVLRCGLAITAGVAAVIHFAVAGEHFQEYWAFGVFMLVVAWLQLGWGLGILLRPSRALVVTGAALNAGVIAVYVITRTVGDVIGPDPHDVEPVGFGDAFCTACEALIVVGALMILLRPLDRPIAPDRAGRLLASIAAVATALLSFSLVDGGSEMVMSMASAEPAASGAPTGSTSMRGMTMTGSPRSVLSLPTDSPAGPVTMPDPAMQMAAGMKMASPGCIQTPTAAQQSASVSLVDATWSANRRYQSLAAAKAAGYRPVTPTGRPVVHYISSAAYRQTLLGSPVIAPSDPQSLVYANTPSGAVLVAVMYIAAPRTTSTPDPGGCLTQWHVHTNLCFAGRRVVAVTDPNCPAGSANRVSPPMLHIWFVPIPGGPTAVDATDQQVVQAAERVAAPHNGSA